MSLRGSPEREMFRHKFEAGYALGFTTVAARYNKSKRACIVVAKTEPHCELYPENLMPSDELVAIGTWRIEGSTEEVTAISQHVRDLLRDHENSPRDSAPLTLTFARGKRRDIAFIEQEERRDMALNDFPAPCTTTLSASSSPSRAPAAPVASRTVSRPVAAPVAAKVAVAPAAPAGPVAAPPATPASERRPAVRAAPVAPAPAAPASERRPGVRAELPEEERGDLRAENQELMEESAELRRQLEESRKARKAETAMWQKRVDGLKRDLDEVAITSPVGRSSFERDDEQDVRERALKAADEHLRHLDSDSESSDVGEKNRDEDLDLNKVSTGAIVDELSDALTTVKRKNRACRQNLDAAKRERDSAKFELEKYKKALQASRALADEHARSRDELQRDLAALRAQNERSMKRKDLDDATSKSAFRERDDLRDALRDQDLEMSQLRADLRETRAVLRRVREDSRKVQSSLERDVKVTKTALSKAQTEVSTHGKILAACLASLDEDDSKDWFEKELSHESESDSEDEYFDSNLSKDRSEASKRFARLVIAKFDRFKSDLSAAKKASRVDRFTALERERETRVIADSQISRFSAVADDKDRQISHLKLQIHRLSAANDTANDALKVLADIHRATVDELVAGGGGGAVVPTTTTPSSSREQHLMSSLSPDAAQLLQNARSFGC